LRRDKSELLHISTFIDMFMQQPHHHARSTQLNWGQVHLLPNRYEEIMRGA
jgi:hypothetical protein